jgi:uncharacterized protein with FMN-binding domain
VIGNRAQRLIARTIVTAAIVAAMVVLILIYVRSGGNGTGAGTVTVRANGGRAATGGQHGGGSASGGSSGSGSPPANPGHGSEEAGNGGEASGGGAGAPPKSGAGGSGTYTGPAVQTPYGPVQVAVAVEAGRIVDVKPLQMPTEHPQSLFISERVAPLLREEVLQAQSAQINIVSGASFTSEGYAESLQQALSQAH